ncbi:MAG: hypothetical protein JNM43_09715 [Planctomycetaceae bacterium]|nr:hypothetical protein [Planctomycetaceae bacterium]
MDCRLDAGGEFLRSRAVGRACSFAGWKAIALTICVAVLLPSIAHADQVREMAEKAGIRVLTEGTSASDTHKSSVAEIPLNALTPKNRLRAQHILENTSQFRRLPSLQYTIDEPIYRYLLQHPDVAVSTWRVMGISRFEMFQTGPQEYEAQAVDGSEGIADILYQDANQVLFICEGNYHNVLLPKPLQASALIWFRAQYTPNAEGTHVVTQKTDVFVRFPSAGLSTVAKMLTPVTNSLMDRNLFELSLYASMMSRAVRDEPDWVVQVADQMEGVLPQRKGELIAVARQARPQMQQKLAPRLQSNAADRNMIMSPQLLFFDPPKQGTKIVAQPGSGTAVVTTEQAPKTGVPAVPVSGGNVTILPASRAAARRNQLAEDARNDVATRKMQSADEFVLQPATPPVGSTATGPSGRGVK